MHCGCVVGSCRARLSAFRELEFIPFNPTDKRTEATVEVIHDRSVFRVRDTTVLPPAGPFVASQHRSMVTRVHALCCCC